MNRSTLPSRAADIAALSPGDPAEAVRLSAGLPPKGIIVPPPRRPGPPTSPPVAGLLSPDLDDASKFVRVPAVPILDVHDHEEKGDVSEGLLSLLATNTNRRCERGDYVAITLGHTLADDVPEPDQPPFVGFARNLTVGTFRDEPCLLADFFFRAEDADLALRFPHRSIERVRSDDPSRNYIDYVCLLRRPPERSLGLLTYARALPAGDDVVRYSRNLATGIRPTTPTTPTTPTPEDEMNPEQLAALTEAITQAVTAALRPVLDAIKPAPDADADADADRVQMEEAAPSGSNSFVPGMVKKDDDEDEDEKARVKMQRLQDQLDTALAENTRLKYSKRFDDLAAEGVLFNREVELAKVLKLPVDLRDGHFKAIRENYQRAPQGRRADPATRAPAESEADERQHVIDYAVRYNIEIGEARSRYRQERAGRAPANDSDRAEVLAYATKHGYSDIQAARTAFRREKDGLTAR